MATGARSLARTNRNIEQDGNFDNNFDLSKFKEWLVSREYSNSTIKTMSSYASRYNYILSDEQKISDLNKVSPIIRTHIVKSLLLVARYNNCYDEVKAKFAKYSIKMHRSNGLDGFLRILDSNKNSDILDYYHKAKSVVKPHEALYLEFLLKTGLRPNEGVCSYNLIIELTNEGKLNEYYNKELNCLIHANYKQFLRKTKNCYLSFVSEKLINDIAKSKPVVYSLVRKRLRNNQLTLRLKELRRFCNTHLINKGLSELEVNLISGRINGLLLKHYFTPKLAELSKKVLTAIESIDTAN